MTSSSPKRQDIQNVHRCLETGRSIYVGNIQSAKNPKTLRKYGIKAVVSVAKGAFLSHSAKELPDYLYIPALDREHYQLDRHFEQTFDFIENNLRKTNVLVHCVAGVSRSASIVVAYLMRKQQIPFDSALDKVSHWRPVVNPNRGFVAQLRKYEKTLEIGNAKSHHQNQQQQSKSVRKSHHKTEESVLSVDLVQDNASRARSIVCSPLAGKNSSIRIQDRLQQIQSNQVSLEQKIKELRESFMRTNKLHNKLKKEIDNKHNNREESSGKRRMKTSISREKRVKFVIVE